MVVCGALEDVIHIDRCFDFQHSRNLSLLVRFHTCGSPSLERVEVAVAGVPLELGHIENEVTKFLRVGARNEAFPHGVALRVKIVFDRRINSAGTKIFDRFYSMPGVISGCVALPFNAAGRTGLAQEPTQFL